MQWFLEEGVRACRDALRANSACEVTGYREDLRRLCGRILFDGAANVEAVEARHEDVEDQEVRPEGADLHETLVTVVRRFHGVSRVQTQDLGQRVEEPRIVVDDEEARRLLFVDRRRGHVEHRDRKSTRLNSSHSQISYAVFCLKKKNGPISWPPAEPTHLPTLEFKGPASCEF